MIRQVNGRKGGGFAVMFLCLAVMAAVFFSFLQIADYALFTYKRNGIAKAMDYSVAAAIQEIDAAASREGLGEGYDEATGAASTDRILLNVQGAQNAFFSTLQANCGIERPEVQDSTLTVMTSTADSIIEYHIMAGKPGSPERLDRTGSLSEPRDLEAAINLAVYDYWGTNAQDRNILYVNGNPRTNEFRDRPYYMAFIKDYEIHGLLKTRHASFAAFKGAKIERKESDE
jgi:hypothetical protein